jgi:hypothetical protein
MSFGSHVLPHHEQCLLHCAEQDMINLIVPSGFSRHRSLQADCEGD